MRVKQIIDSHKYTQAEAQGKTAEAISWVDRIEGDAGIPASETPRILPATLLTLLLEPRTIVVVKGSGCRCVVM